MIMQSIIQLDPLCSVTRSVPINDIESLIAATVTHAAEDTFDLVVVIGGSGGGHRYSPTLGKDFTHSALETILNPKYSGEIYGKNGHMWCKLLCGLAANTLVINLPGPYREAKAAMAAFAAAYTHDSSDLKGINQAMLEAVTQQYPVCDVKSM